MRVPCDGEEQPKLYASSLEAGAHLLKVEATKLLNSQKKPKSSQSKLTLSTSKAGPWAHLEQL